MTEATDRSISPLMMTKRHRQDDDGLLDRELEQVDLVLTPR